MQMRRLYLALAVPSAARLALVPVELGHPAQVANLTVLALDHALGPNVGVRPCR
jgi:hypothetical protein